MALLQPTESQSPGALLTVEVGSAANFSGSFSPEGSPPRIVTAGAADGDGPRSGPTTTNTGATTQQTAQVTNKSIAFSLPRSVPTAKAVVAGKRAIAIRSASQAGAIGDGSADVSEAPSDVSSTRRQPPRDRYYFHVDYAPKLKGEFTVTDAPKAHGDDHPHHLNTRGGTMFASFEFGAAFDAESSVGTSSFGGDAHVEPRKPPRHLRPAEMALVSATPAPAVAAAAGSSFAGGCNLNASFSTQSGTATPNPYDASRNGKGAHFGQGSGGAGTPRSHSASSIPSSAPDVVTAAGPGAAYIVAEKDVLRPRGWSLCGEPSPMPNSDDLRREVRNREIAGARSGLDATREERAKIRLGLVPGAASAATSGQRGPALSTDPGQAMHFRAIRERQRRTDEAREESHRARVDDGAVALQRVQELLKEDAAATAAGERMARPRPSLALVRHLQTAHALSPRHQGTTASAVDAAVGRLRGSVRQSDAAVADSAGLLRLVIATDMAARPEGGRPSDAEEVAEGAECADSLAASRLPAATNHRGSSSIDESNKNLSQLHRRATGGGGRAQRGGNANSIAAIRRASAPGRTFDPELEAEAVEAVGQEETQGRGRIERDERRIFAEDLAKPFARFHTAVISAVSAVVVHFDRFQASHVPWVPIGAAIDAEPGGGSVARSRAQSRVGSRMPSRAGSRAGSRAVSRQGSFAPWGGAGDAPSEADGSSSAPQQPIQAGMTSINTTRAAQERRNSAVDAMAAAIGRLGEPDAGGAVKGSKPAEPVGRSGRVVAVFSPQGGTTPHHISRKKEEMTAAIAANQDELRRARAAAFTGGPAIDVEHEAESSAGETFAEQVARLNSCSGRIPRGDSVASTSKGESFGAAIASVGDTSPSQGEHTFGAGAGDCDSPSKASSSSSDLVQRLPPAGDGTKDSIRFVNKLRSYSAFGGGPSATPTMSGATTATVTPRKAENYELPGLAAQSPSPGGFLQQHRRGTEAPGGEGVGLPPSAATDSFMGRAAVSGTMRVRDAKLQKWVSGGGRARWIDQIESRIAIDKAFLEVLHVIGSQLEDAVADSNPKHAARFFHRSEPGVSSGPSSPTCGQHHRHRFM